MSDVFLNLICGVCALHTPMNLILNCRCVCSSRSGDLRGLTEQYHERRVFELDLRGVCSSHADELDFDLPVRVLFTLRRSAWIDGAVL